MCESGLFTHGLQRKEFEKKLLVIVIIFNDFVWLKSSNNYSPTNNKQILWS